MREPDGAGENRADKERTNGFEEGSSVLNILCADQLSATKATMFISARSSHSFGVLGLSLVSFLLGSSLALGCGNDKSDADPQTKEQPANPSAAQNQTAPAKPTPVEERPLQSGLLLAMAQFEIVDGKATPKPAPARLDILRPKSDGSAWEMTTVKDKESNVLHKAMVHGANLLTFGGMNAVIKRVTLTPEAKSVTLWKKDFGGKFNRMRDAEFLDDKTLAVATHDQGVVALLPIEGGEPKIIYDKKNTFIHEIEIGDLDGDGAPEVYATPSEPNKSTGGEQHGEVIRIVDGKSSVVADLGNRHAKEILVDDVDGDGRDELYVAVEALTEKGSAKMLEPVEIRRYDHDTAPDKGIKIAEINDMLNRFLTAGDVDGDGKKEMVAAAFKSGLWLLRPGKNPKGEWSIESVDKDSSGFEHAAILLDLDEDGRDELYVAADVQGEVRRYVWVNGRAKREVIFKRDVPRAYMTWNIMPVPLTMLRDVPVGDIELK